MEHHSIMLFHNMTRVYLVAGRIPALGNYHPGATHTRSSEALSQGFDLFGGCAEICYYSHDSRRVDRWSLGQRWKVTPGSLGAATDLDGQHNPLWQRY